MDDRKGGIQSRKEEREMEKLHKEKVLNEGNQDSETIEL
jgi:hypothetical protein